jgi:hypothetical protein
MGWHPMAPADAAQEVFDVVQVERRAADGDRQYARLIWALTREFKLAETTPLASSR